MENKHLDSKIDYSALEQQRTQLLQNQLKVQLKAREVGKNESLRRAVLGLVVEAKYEIASETIDGYLNLKRYYPGTLTRSEPHATHAKELINAIRAKRNFPNLSQLSMSKQQEILDHAVRHFEDLKASLKMIEHIVKDEAVKDIRSTVWVVRTTAYVGISIAVTAFVMEFTGGFGALLWKVFSEFSDASYSAIMRALGS